MVVIRKKPIILLYGGFWAANRCEYLVEFLIASGYYVSGVFPDFYSSERQQRNFLTKVFRKIAFPVFALIELFVKASFADVIYILPGNVSLFKYALLAARVFKTRIILEFYDSMYTHYMENKGAGSIAPEELKRVKQDNVNLNPENEKLAIRKADYIIHVSNCELGYLSKVLEINIDFDKVFVVPIFCSDRPAYAREFMQDGVFRICWWGSFLPMHGLDYILIALNKLKQDGLNFECDLFGAYSAGSRAYFFEKYRQEIASQSLDSHVKLRRDLTFIDGKLPEYLISHCDLSLGIFGDTLKAESSVPNKLIESLSMGIPTLTRSSPVLEEFFDVQADFWTCQPSPESIAQAISDVYHQKSHPVHWGKTRDKVRNTFNAETYRKVVSKVLNQVNQDLL